MQKHLSAPHLPVRSIERSFLFWNLHRSPSNDFGRSLHELFDFVNWRHYVANMGTRRIELGPVGHAVRANVSRLRELQGLTLQEVSDRLARFGRPIVPSGISKIESGFRRVDVDDLVGLAAALGTTTDRLLRTPDGSPMPGHPGMTRDDYEDSVAVASRLVRYLDKFDAAGRKLLQSRGTDG
jgi:transcriptional regulator with XRE-family HTH domain